jgi:hypothetical protein
MREDASVADEVRAVFVFGDDPQPMVFQSLGDAMGWMEAIDVENGEYDALYTLDGRAIDASVSGNQVVLEVTNERNERDVRHRLREAASRGLVTSDPEDLGAVANELLRNQWNSRWPKHPRWLSRRLHGDGPAEV